ncbi:hypothetical protein diail_5720 [Diaporthe ilicicola]|nr:hypothetical protein diail_5720 [Diaporthe ilicicola]
MAEDPDKPKPLPMWLQLRITASTLLSKSRRLGTGSVIVLPFKKIAKLDVSSGEIAAMEFVRANTTVPIPKILEVHDKQPDGSAHIVMSQVPGDDLEDVLHTLSDGQIASIVKELAGYLGQLRQLEPPKNAASASTTGKQNDGPLIGGVGGVPGHDVRLGSAGWGPFRSLADFHTHLRFGEPLEDWEHEPAVTAVHGKGDGEYRLRFTHADIALRNIRVRGGRIVGIIDWEFAGWYPEYWEYTKMHYGGAGERPAWRKFFDAVEAEEGIQKYTEELRAEEAIWARAGPFGYD